MPLVMTVPLPSGLISIVSTAEVDPVPEHPADIRYQRSCALYNFWKGELELLVQHSLVIDLEQYITHNGVPLPTQLTTGVSIFSGVSGVTQSCRNSAKLL